MLLKKISLEGIYFTYPNTSKTTLNNLNIEISANSTTGLVGLLVAKQVQSI